MFVSGCVANSACRNGVERFAVLRHAGGCRDLDGARARESGEFRIEYRGEQLAHAVGAEVEAKHAIAIAHALIGADDGGQDELVGDVLAVRIRDRGRRIGERCALAFDDGLVGFRHALPAIVAIHRVIAAA